MKNRLYTIQEVADILGVSTKTLRRWDQRGRFVPTRTAGNQRRYTQQQILGFKTSFSAKASRGQAKIWANLPQGEPFFKPQPSKEFKPTLGLPSILNGLPSNSFLKHHFLLKHKTTLSLHERGKDEVESDKSFEASFEVPSLASSLARRPLARINPFKVGFMLACLVLLLSFAGGVLMTRYGLVAGLAQKKDQFVKFIANLPQISISIKPKDLGFVPQDDQAVLAATIGDSDLILNVNVPSYFSQSVGIGTTTVDPSAILDLVSEDKGFLAPRMTAAQLEAISSPAAGLFVYNTDTNHYNMYNGTAWQGVFTSIGDSTVGDAFTETGTNGKALWFNGTSGGRVKVTAGSISGAKDILTLPDTTGTFITTGNLTAINTVGTISTGVWNGTVLTVPYGGTGVSTLTGIVLGNGSGVMTGLTTSAGIAGAIGDETGTGLMVFSTSPAITTSITTASTSFALINTVATTVNFAGAATTLSIGAATGTVTLNNAAVAITGALTANGDVTLGNAITDNITFTGRVAADSDLLPIGTTGTNDLGSSSLPWDNVYANNVFAATSGFSGYFQRNSQALSPTNISDDFLLGATSTSSAKFGFLNIAGGNPTATISSNLSLVVPTGNGPSATLNLLNNGSLNIQRSIGGDAGLTSALFIQNNGNVGIGMTAPTTPLEVQGTIYATSPGGAGTTPLGSRLALGSPGGSPGLVIAEGDGSGGTLRRWDIFVNSQKFNISDNTSGGTRLLIDTSGNVGIGNTTPLTALDVTGSASLSANLSFRAAATNLYYLDNSNLNIQRSPKGDAGATSVMYLANSGNVGIGTTAPATLFDVNSLFNVASGGNVGIGTVTPTSFKLEVGGNIGPTAGSTYDLGSSSRRWNNVYGVTANFTNLSTSLATISGTTTQDFLINSDNVTADLEDATLSFSRGTGTNSQFKWNSTTKQLSTNSPSFAILPDSTIAYSGTAALMVNQVQNQDIFTASASGTTRFTIKNSGNVGIGISNPLTALDVVGSASISANLSFRNAATNLYYLDNSNLNIQRSPKGDAGATSVLYLANNGNVGIGTTSPENFLHVVAPSGDLNAFVGLDTYSTAGATAGMYGRRARGTLSSPSALQSGDLILQITAAGYGATGFGTNKASIRMWTAENWTDAAQGTYIAFETTTAGTTTRDERWRITDAGILQSNGAQTIQTSTGNLTLATLAGNGNILLTPNGTGKVGIGTTSPLATLDVRGNLGTIPAASISAVSSFASLIVDNSGVGDLFTASKSGATKFVITNAGNVGIGTTSPSAIPGGETVKMHISGSLSGTNIGTLIENTNSAAGSLAALNLKTGASTNYWQWFARNGDLFAGVANVADYMVIKSGGNVGIGNTAPLTALDVTGSASLSANLSLRGAGTAHTFNILDNGTLNFQRYPGGDAANNSSVLFLQNNGNVGIGTTAPNHPLELFGTDNNIVSLSSGASGLELRSTASNLNSYIDFVKSSTSTVGSGTPDFNARIAYRAANDGRLGFTTDGTDVDQLVLSPTGNLGIGITAPLAALDVVGSASLSANLSFRAAATNLYYLNNSNLNIQRSPKGDAGTTSVMYLANNGNVGIGTTAPTDLLHLSAEAAANTFIALDTYSTSGATPGILARRARGTTGSPSAIQANDLILQIMGAAYGTTGWGSQERVRITFNAAEAWSDSAQGTYMIFETTGTGTTTRTERLRITAGGNIGINNTTPLAALDVTGSASLSANLSLRGAGTAHTFNILDNGTLNFQRYPGGDAANNSSVLFLQNNGNVGIGTTNPLNALSVFQDTGVSSGEQSLVIVARTGAGGNDGGVKFGYRADGSNVTGGFMRALNSLPLFLGTAGSGQAVTILDAGNVGIGNTAPLTALDVTGSASLSANLSLRGSGTAHTFNILDNGSLNFRKSIGGDVSMTNVLYLENSGNVGIGNTAPGAMLSVGSSTPALINSAGLITVANTTDSTSGSTGSINTLGGLGVTKDLAVGGGDIVTAATTFNLLNTTATTVNFAGAATTLSIGAATGTVTLNNATVAITGALTANGDVTLGNAVTDNITFTGRVAQDSDLLPIGTTGTNDLGSSSLPWDNVYADNIFSATSGYSGYWQRNSQALSPTNISDDILVGATATSSALVKLSGTNVAGLNYSWFNGGNVGIGTTAPGDKLEINVPTEGNLKLGSANIGYIQIQHTTGATTFDISQTVASGDLRLYATRNIQFRTSSADPAVTLLQTGNVGIGNTAPLTALDVTGSASLSANLSLRGAGTAHTFNILDNGTLNFQRYPSGDAANNSSVLFLQNNGNVGIGTTNPLARLSLGASAVTDLFFLYDDGTNKYGLGVTGNQLEIYSPNAASDHISLGTRAVSGGAFSEKMRVQSNGNVGIGNTTPLTALDVTGSASLSANLSFRAAATNLYYLDNSNLNIQRSPKGDAGAISVLYLANNGNVGIGTTSPGSRLTLADDSIVGFGTDSDIALVNRSTALTANTFLAGVLTGTPVATAIPANSLLLSNTTASGDIGLYLNDTSGNSWEYLRLDGSAKETIFNDASSDIDFRVESDGNINAFQIDAGVYGGVGAIGIGSAAAGDTGSVLIRPQALTLGNNNNYGVLTVSATNAVTIAGATTTDIAAGIFVNAPVFTATGTLTNAASVYIDAAPTTGTNKYALWVDAGTARLDGNTVIGTGATTPDTTLHVAKGSGGTITPNINTVLTVENSTSAWITIATPDTSAEGGILFANDVDGATAAKIGFEPGANDRFEFALAGSDRLYYSIGAFAFQEATTISTPINTNLTLSNSGTGNIILSPGVGVGIGNTTPLTALDVTGSASLSANLSLRGAGTAHTFNVLDNGTLNIQRSPGGDAGLATALYIQNSGNIGIGTNTPTGLLTLRGGGPDLRMEATGGGGTVRMYVDNPGGVPGLHITDGTTERLSIGTASEGGLVYTQPNFSSIGSPALRIIGGTHTGLTASTERSDIYFNLNRTVQWATGALATQRVLNIESPTIAFVGASTLTTASTLDIAGPPAAGTNATITTSIGLNMPARAVGSGVGTGIGMYINAPTGATTANYAALFIGGNVGIGNTTPLTALDVTGSASLSANLSFRAATTNLYYLDNSSLNIQRSPKGDTGATSVLFLQNNGNVGIGVTNPTSLLTLPTNQFIQWQTAPGQSASRSWGIKNDVSNWGDFQIVMSDANDNTLDTLAVAITSSGNMAIGSGINNPTQKLIVYGASTLPASSGTTQNGLFRIQSTSNTVLDMGSNGNSPYQGWIQSTDAGNLALTYPLLLNPIGGNVGIGVTAPLLRLDVQDSQAATAAAQIYNTSTNVDADGLILKLGNTSTTAVAATNHFLSFETFGIGIVGSVQGSGGKGVTYATSGIADFAEYFKKDQNSSIPFGSVVCFDSNGLAVACDNNSNKIIGVASERPAFLGGENLGDKSVPVGLVGQVRTRVSTANGAIKIGDPLTTSETAGVAVKATNVGQILGKAIEPFDGAMGQEGNILVSVNIGWYNPSIYVSYDGTLAGMATTVASIGDQLTLQGQNLASQGDALQAQVASNSARLQSLEATNYILANDPLFKNSQDKVSQLESKLDLLSLQMEQQASISAFLAGIQSGQVLGTSTSAALNATLGDVELNNATIADNLMVLGRTTVSDLGVTGNINAGLLSIHGIDGEINTLSGDLYLQKDGLGGVDILAGKVVIDTAGNMTVAGTITADAVIAGNYTVLGGESIGSSTIPAGSTSIEVATTIASESSKIFLTSTSLTDKQITVVQKSNGKFKVAIPSPTTSPISFDWWIVGNK